MIKKYKIHKLLFLIIIIIIVLILLLINNSNNHNQNVVDNCINLCKMNLDKNVDLSKGPCLSNNVANDWVCDVAHNPREDIDNNIQNQCSDYLNNSKHHFVELTPNCKLIRAI